MFASQYLEDPADTSRAAFGVRESGRGTALTKPAGKPSSRRTWARNSTTEECKDSILQANQLTSSPDRINCRSPVASTEAKDSMWAVDRRSDGPRPTRKEGAYKNNDGTMDLERKGPKTEQREEQRQHNNRKQKGEKEGKGREEKVIKMKGTIRAGNNRNPQVSTRTQIDQSLPILGHCTTTPANHGPGQPSDETELGSNGQG